MFTYQNYSEQNMIEDLYLVTVLLAPAIFALGFWAGYKLAWNEIQKMLHAAK